MTERQHADPPGLCAECFDALFAQVASSAGHDLKYHHCLHRGGGTLIRAEVHDGVVVSWRLSAPISADEAKAADAELQRLREFARREGALPPEGPLH